MRRTAPPGYSPAPIEDINPGDEVWLPGRRAPQGYMLAEVRGPVISCQPLGAADYMLWVRTGASDTGQNITRGFSVYRRTTPGE